MKNLSAETFGPRTNILNNNGPPRLFLGNFGSPPGKMARVDESVYLSLLKHIQCRCTTN